MNDKLVLKRARELCGENVGTDRHEEVLRDAYQQMRKTDINGDVLARHVNNLKTRGKVPDYLRESILQEAERNPKIVSRQPRQRRGETRVAA